jgi:hypothetical protein
MVRFLSGAIKKLRPSQSWLASPILQNTLKLLDLEFFSHSLTHFSPHLEHLRNNWSVPLSESLIQARALSSSKKVLLVFVILGDSTPRWLGIAWGLWLSLRKLVFPSSWEDSEWTAELTLMVAWRGFGAEINPTLYELINGDVVTFMVLNFENQSCISCAFIDLLLNFLFILFLNYSFIHRAWNCLHILLPSVWPAYYMLIIHLVDCC